MRAHLKRLGSASQTPGRRSRIGFGVLAVCAPAAMSVLFSQIDWFWQSLGWAGVATVAFLTLMALYVIAAARRYASVSAAEAELKRLHERVGALAVAVDAQHELAEAMWCDQQCDKLLAKHRDLNATFWPMTLNALKKGTPLDAKADRWTAAAEDLAMWARRALPALYTEEDTIEKIEPQLAPDEDQIPEVSRMEYRTLYWRKQMMDKYVSSIAAKLESRAEQLRSRFIDAGNPLERQYREIADI